MRVVLGFSSDPKDCITGNVEIGRARKSDPVRLLLKQAATEQGGWIQLGDPTFAGGVSVAAPIEVQYSAIVWATLHEQMPEARS